MSSGSKSAERSAAEIAAAIILGELGIIEGSVRLAAVAHDAVEDWRVDPDFVVFGVLASETDHLPTGSARQYWNPDVLTEADVHIARIEEAARNEVIRACSNVVKRFSDA